MNEHVWEYDPTLPYVGSKLCPSKRATGRVCNPRGHFWTSGTDDDFIGSHQFWCGPDDTAPEVLREGGRSFPATRPDLEQQTDTIRPATPSLARTVASMGSRRAPVTQPTFGFTQRLAERLNYYRGAEGANMIDSHAKRMDEAERILKMFLDSQPVLEAGRVHDNDLCYVVTAEKVLPETAGRAQEYGPPMFMWVCPSLEDAKAQVVASQRAGSRVLWTMQETLTSEEWSTEVKLGTEAKFEMHRVKIVRERVLGAP